MMKIFAVVISLALLSALGADLPPRPFFLWTAEEAAAIRSRLETDPDAAIQLERTLYLSREVRGRVILVDLFRAAVLQESGVVVDNLQAQPVARGDDGTVGHHYRADFENELEIRFVAVRADGTYPGVAHERALVLAEHYLLDVTWLRNADPQQPRRFEWQALSPMSARSADWEPTSALEGMTL